MTGSVGRTRDTVNMSGEAGARHSHSNADCTDCRTGGTSWWRHDLGLDPAGPAVEVFGSKTKVKSFQDTVTPVTIGLC